MDLKDNLQHGMFIELRQRLQSGVLILRGDVAGCSAGIKVSSGTSSLQVHTARGVRRVELPPGVSVVEEPHRPAPAAAGGELHVRLRLKVDRHTETRRSGIQRLQAHKSYIFHCQACGVELLQRVFQRVLPLPNGNWNALVDDWCCHPDPFANRKLLPRPEDCLTGDTYMLVAWDKDSDQTLTRETNSSHTAVGNSHDSEKPSHRNQLVSCKKCNSLLGEALSEDAVKLYITEVLVRMSYEDKVTAFVLPRSQFLERTLAARLVELSSVQSTFRFSVQTPSGKAFILLWLLNTDTLVASFPEEPVGSNISASPSAGHDDEHQSCRAVGAVKVLYLPCAPSTHQEILESWERDIGVHPLTLPLATCQEVLDLLRSSTSRLPASLRSMNSYQVALIRA
ncbi:E3 ubiquitin-protein ligase E3D isoform X2 [Denticeps clupeoides]|uniref:E3 ubiquitin-protein ligase E3D isoform X2 n=1 Tax=Denticeps clupeoides TaxID=299321 RepID=UPI0010A45EC8|nr:E3 ubiquitin-protein ligase E3D isoform X2 [Denticeps clupeoides]